MPLEQFLPHPSTPRLEGSGPNSKTEQRDNDGNGGRWGAGKAWQGVRGVCELGLTWPEHWAREELAPGVLFLSLTAGYSKSHFPSPALVSS